MDKDLTSLFFPKSIAVIGASRNPQKVGAVVLKNIIGSGYKGMVFPVNPNTDRICDLQCFKDIAALPQVPDLAAIAIPVPAALEALIQVGEKGIKNAVVLSAGFKETGKEGGELEEQLISIAQKCGINVLGPNCLGFVNNLCPINVTFSEVENQNGALRFISQSGAIASSLFDWCQTQGIGFSQFVTLGNKAVIDENDVLEFLQNNKSSTSELNHAQPIGLYLESISRGDKFLKLTSQITRTDPIFILKPGKTSASVKAMQSHTGSIAGEDAVFEAVLSQAGIVRAQTLEDFFDLSRSFAWKESPRGPKVAIISNAGGPAVISADAVVNEGLELSEFDLDTHQKLLHILPRSAAVLNPVDVLGDALAERYRKACEVILENNQADALVVILTPQIMTQIEQTAALLGGLSEKYQKLIVCSFIGGSLVAEGEKILNKLKIPSFRFPERAIWAIGRMWEYKKHKQDFSDTGFEKIPELPNAEQINLILEKAAQKGEKALDNFEANNLVSLAGISTPKTALISKLEEAENFAASYGYPLVLKLSAPGLIHKKEIGGVVMDIADLVNLEMAWEKLEQEKSQLKTQINQDVSIQIQKEVEKGTEVIIGVKRDPSFGPVLLCGAGGSLAQLINDRNLHLLPINMTQVKKLVEKSKVFILLSGCGLSAGLNKLYETIVLLGELALNYPQISDIEINPAIVGLSGVWAVDNKVILGQNKALPKDMVNFQRALATNCQTIAYKLHYCTFEAEDPLISKPGQYISVQVAPGRVNCYSLATRDTPNSFGLLVDSSPGGPGSKFFENLKVGDKINFLGPFGNFLLRENDGAKHLLFLGTGCGFAPLRAQIEAALKRLPNVPITLYLGLEYPKEVFWQDYFENLSKNYPNFNFKIAVSQPDSSWKEPTGFITAFLEKDIQDGKDYAAYLSGNKLMIENSIKILFEKGCPKERIYTERY